MSQGADPDEIGLMNIDEQLPVLEYPQPGLDIIQVMQLSSGQHLSLSRCHLDAGVKSLSDHWALHRQSDSMLKCVRQGLSIN